MIHMYSGMLREALCEEKEKDAGVYVNKIYKLCEHIMTNSWKKENNI